MQELVTQQQQTLYGRHTSSRRVPERMQLLELSETLRKSDGDD